MAEYDGSIRINTEIQTKQAQVQLSTLENRIVKTSDKIASLRSKMDSLKDAKIPTTEYTKLQSQLDSAIKKYEELDEQVKTFQKIGMDAKSEPFRKAQDEAQELYMKIEDIRGAMFDLEESGKAFTLGADTEEFEKLGQQLQYAENDLEVLNQKHDVLQLKQEKAAEGYKRLGSVAKQSFDSIGKVLTKADSYVNSFGKRLKNIAQKILPTFHKETKRTNTVLGQFSTRLKSLLSGVFIFNAISAGFRKLFSGVGESFQNFYNYSNSFQKSVNDMRSSLVQLKNSMAAAFAPIVQTAIPYIQKLISYINEAVNAVAQLIAALMGKKTYTKALKTDVGAIKDTADASKDASDKTSSALDKVSDSADKAKEALEGYLNPLDEINKYDSAKEVEEIEVDIKTPDSSDLKDDIEDGIGDAFETVFEELPIEEYWKNLADKLKNIFSQFFAPIKEAWNREGKFVMDSWKYALGEVWSLIKSIGSDFLEVWQQEKTIKIFEDLLHIIGDIGLVVGNLAHNFRLAWEENETGKRILEGIRDIIGVIVANIRHAADATVEWSKNLNFSPLLTAIKGWIESLVPVFDNLSGIITDFYEKVLLPLGKWTIEKGLPELLQVFIDFNNKVDWEALRSRLAQFWEHLEPFAETVGEGLIIFIERCANALADFINSPAFDNFLTMIENWMDSVSPEDVADALEAIAKSIIALKVAVVGFSAISKGMSALKELKKILQFFGAGGGISSALGVLKSIGTTIAGWAPHIAAGVAIVDAIKRIKEAVSERIDTSGFGITDWISETLKLALKGWQQEFEGWKISLELWWQDTWMSEAIWNFGQWWNEKIKPWFTQERWIELWETVKQSALTKWEEIKTTITTKIEEVKINISTKMEEIKTSLLIAWENIKTYILSTWENLKQSAIDIWNGISQFFSDTWNSITTTISETWENITTFLQEKWEHIKETVVEIFTNIHDFLTETWENIKEKINEVWENIKEKVTSAIQAVKDKITDVMNGVKEVWSGAWDAMKEKVTSIIDGVKETIQSAFDWITEKVSAIGEKLSSIGSTAKSIFSGGFSSLFGGSSTFSTTTYSMSSISFPYAANPAVAALSSTPIPRLATGAVIPANKEFLAVLGDQKHGTNIEAPLDTLMQANEQLLLKTMSQLGLTGGGNSNGQPIIIKWIADGKELTDLVIKNGKVYQMSSGNNPFLLGIT